MTRTSLLGATLAAALIGAPGLALANTGGATTGNNNGNTTNTSRPYANIGQGGYSGTQMPIPNNNGNNNNQNANMRPSQRNGDLADNGDARASKVIGTAVYNGKNQKVGSVDDVLIGHNGVWAVISTNQQKVAVPFQEFVFGNSNSKGNDKMVLPQSTQAQLNSMPAFKYDATNYANNNNNGNNGGGVFSNSNNNNNNTSNGNGHGVFGNGSNAHPNGNKG